MMPSNEVILKSHQHEHVERIINNLSSNLWVIDNSPPGSGKTHTTSYAIKHFGFAHVVVVCPATVESVWQNVTEIYNLPTLSIISYESLRGTQNHPLKHNFLERKDVGKETTFTATDYLQTIIEEGTFFIFDECQKLKNVCDIYNAVKAITLKICEIRGVSRFIMLSGSLFDKEKQVVSFLRVLGIIKHRFLYLPTNTGILKPVGIEELRKICASLDAQATARIMASTVLTKSSAEHICFLLYTQVIQHHLVSSMPSPKIDVPIDCKNGYYVLSPERTTKLRAYVSGLKTAASYNEVKDDIDASKVKWGAITHFRTIIELQKVEIFVRKTKEILNSNPNAKVILFFNYTNPLMKTAELCQEFNPLILTGSIDKKMRPQIIRLFQEHNLEHRLLISNLTVACLGIDLDDTDGGFPRYVFISPSYCAMNIHQGWRRVYRAGTKSGSVVRIVYGECGEIETSIINALSKKKDVMKATLIRQVEEGIKFPGEYDNEHEGDVKINSDIQYEDSSSGTEEIILEDEKEEDIIDTDLFPDVGYRNLLIAAENKFFGPTGVEVNKRPKQVNIFRPVVLPKS